MSTTQTDTGTSPGPNGHRGADRLGDLQLEPARGLRRPRVPELLVGSAIAVAFALAAVLWQANSTQREPALALATDVARGEVIDAADVRVVYVGSDEPIVTLRRDQAAIVVGHAAAADLEAGTLLTPLHVADAQQVEAGEGVVGLALDPGQFPAMGLAPGDLVNVVGAGGGEELLAEKAVVFAIEDLGGQGRRFISIRTSEPAANRIAAVAEVSSIRLVLVAD